MIHSLRLATVIVTGIAYLASAAEPVRIAATDSLMEDHKIIYFGEGHADSRTDSIRTLIEHFYYDQFRNFQDPAAPYFLFMSRDANMAMGVGGVVRMRGYFDPGNSMPTPAFNLSDIPVCCTPLNRNHLGTTPSGTALFFRIIGRNRKLGTYQLYIEAKFNGYASRDFKLSKAYAQIRDWTVGYATSTFSDGAAIPPAVDANGATMKMDNTAVLIRYMHSFRKSGLTLAASVETPAMNIQEVAGETASRSMSMPNIAAFVQYEWAKEQHIRLAAITRFLPYRNLVTGRNSTPVGYGFQLSTVFNPIDALTVYGTFNAGRSYANAGGDFNLGKYDLVEDLDAPGKLNTVPGFGYMLGLTYHFNTRLFSTVSFGQGRSLPSDGHPGDEYKYGIYGGVNLFYDMSPRIRFGGEFNFGKRQNFNGCYGWARRIGAMCQFSF